MQKNIIVEIEQRYQEFPKTFRKLADYVKENIRKIPFMSISELGSAVGVSDASVTRFVHALSFSGYAEFSSCASMDVQRDLSPLPWLKTATLSTPSSVEDKDFLRSRIEKSAQSLVDLYTPNFERNFWQVVKVITNARRVYLMGSRSSQAPAVYLASVLYNLMENVILLKEGDYLPMYDATEHDCVIVIGFSRYSKPTSKIADYFYRKGCPVISFTDSYTSPLALTPECVLLFPHSSDSPSIVHTLSVSVFLIDAIVRQDPDRHKERLEGFEQLNHQNNFFI